MKTYKVWMMPCFSREIHASSEEEAVEIASRMSIGEFHEHTDMCEITAEETEE